jgi:hypothetical protein
MVESLVLKVTKIITIGWRGAEQHFLKLMAQRLQGSSRVDIVTAAATESEAQETLAQMQAASIPAQVSGGVGGC